MYDPEKHKRPMSFQEFTDEVTARVALMRRCPPLVAARNIKESNVNMRRLWLEGYTVTLTSLEVAKSVR